MKKMLMALMLALAGPHAQAALPIELSFKGYRIGALKSDIPGMERFKCEARSWVDELCQQDLMKIDLAAELESIAEEPIRDIWLSFFDGELHGIQIYVLPDSAPEIAKALRDRFGEPVATREVLQNRLGARIESRTWSWDMPQGKIVVEEYCRKIDQACVSYHSPTYATRVALRVREADKGRQRDL